MTAIHFLKFDGDMDDVFQTLVDADEGTFDAVSNLLHHQVMHKVDEYCPGGVVTASRNCPGDESFYGAGSNLVVLPFPHEMDCHTLRSARGNIPADHCLPDGAALEFLSGRGFISGDGDSRDQLVRCRSNDGRLTQRGQDLRNIVQETTRWPQRQNTLCSHLRIGKERSEEHTSELQSRGHLVCRLLLEKKNNRRAET